MSSTPIGMGTPAAAAATPNETNSQEQSTSLLSRVARLASQIFSMIARVFSSLFSRLWNRGSSVTEQAPLSERDVTVQPPETPSYSHYIRNMDEWGRLPAAEQLEFLRTQEAPEELTIRLPFQPNQGEVNGDFVRGLSDANFRYFFTRHCVAPRADRRSASPSDLTREYRQHLRRLTGNRDRQDLRNAIFEKAMTTDMTFAQADHVLTPVIRAASRGARQQMIQQRPDLADRIRSAVRH